MGRLKFKLGMGLGHPSPEKMMEHDGEPKKKKIGIFGF